MKYFRRGHHFRWGNMEDPSCSFCEIKRSAHTTWCPRFWREFLKKSGSLAFGALIGTLWATFVAWFFIGVVYLLLGWTTGNWSLDWSFVFTWWGLNVALFWVGWFRD